MGASSTVRVLLVHPHRLTREALAFSLAHQNGISVVRCVAEVEGVLDQLEMLRPDVYTIDARGPSNDGLVDLQHLRARVHNARVLVTGVSADTDPLLCIEAGANGYLADNASLQDFIDHIHAIARGEAICSGKVVGLLFSRVAEAARERQRSRLPDAHITPREREIISLVNAGLSNKEIAIRLRIETQTVKNHVHNILEKLQIEGRRDLARYRLERTGTGTFASTIPSRYGAS